MVLSKALNLGKNLADVFCFCPIELPEKRKKENAHINTKPW
jgi:hypothetical protein